MVSNNCAIHCQNQEYLLSKVVPKSQHDRINPPLPSNLDYLDYPEYIPQYLQITQKWIDDNSDQINCVADKLLLNKGLINHPEVFDANK